MHIRRYSYSSPALSAAVLELQAEAALFFLTFFLSLLQKNLSFVSSCGIEPSMRLPV
jgi:hypothetical protein